MMQDDDLLGSWPDLLPDEEPVPDIAIGPLIVLCIVLAIGVGFVLSLLGALSWSA